VEQPTSRGPSESSTPVNSDPQLALRKKLAFVLPNALTTANLFLGFFAIVATTRNNWEAAALAILMAAFSDGLDGRIARLTKTQSRFGEEYDSMSDLVSFGVAPALLMFFWALTPYGRWGWIASFLYLTCAALRLTRFNVQKQNIEKRYFQGCPSPLAACTVAAAVLFYEDLEKVSSFKDQYMLAIMITLAVSMVSTFRFRSFKDLRFKSQTGFAYLILILAMLLMVARYPERYLFPLAMVYVASGPLFEILRFAYKHLKSPPKLRRKRSP
jgi:CDP-diacylglycerol--serine O-phosphatidyltransferase